jgi:hypothetical protein
MITIVSVLIDNNTRPIDSDSAILLSMGYRWLRYDEGRLKQARCVQRWDSVDLSALPFPHTQTGAKEYGTS